jgi:hypothetical protein
MCGTASNSDRQSPSLASQRPRSPQHSLQANAPCTASANAYTLTKWKLERKVDVTKKVIADAKGWDSDAGAYTKVRDKLIRDLTTEASAGSAALSRQARRPKKPH